MKKILLLLLISFMGLQNVVAENDEIIYSIDYNDGGKTTRSIIKKPLHIYRQNDYISIVSDVEQRLCVVISDMNGVEVKNETVTIVPEQDTLLYIGDLSEGTYELTIETESYTLYGTFEVE